MIPHLPEVLLHQTLQFLNVFDLFQLARSCHIIFSDIHLYLKERNTKIIQLYFPNLLSDPFYVEPKSAFLQHYELSRERIVVVRGFLTYSMNVTTQKWKRCHDSRRDRGYFAQLYYKGDIYAIGTYSLVAAGTVERYSPFTDFWNLVSPIPKKLRSVGAAVVGDNLYITGGIESFSDVVDDKIYLFDYQKNENNERLKISNDTSCWIDVQARLLRPRYRHAAVGYKGKIWIAGGSFENFEITNTVEIYDPQTGNVDQGPSMLAQRDFTSLLTVRNELYVVGGDVDMTGNPIIRTIEKYDENTQQWIYIASFKDTRRGFSTCCHQNKIYVFCGSNNSQHHIKNWDAFDVVTRQWDSETNPDALRSMPLIDSWGQATLFPGVKIVTD